MKKKLFNSFKKKNQNTFIKPFIKKFSNLFIKKGFKNKSIRFFYKLFREHKRKIISYFFWKYKNSINFLNNKFLIAEFKKRVFFKPFFKYNNFISILRRVSNIITFPCELKSGNFKTKKTRKEKLIPQFVSPWRGFRLGLNLLIKNSKIKPVYIKQKTKVYTYQLLTEIWETDHKYSLTYQNILDFLETLFNYSENIKYVSYHSLIRVNRNIRIMSEFKNYKSVAKTLNQIPTLLKRLKTFKITEKKRRRIKRRKIRLIKKLKKKIINNKNMLNLDLNEKEN